MEQNESADIYTFLDDSIAYKSLDTLPIKILAQPYSGVEFRFTRVSMIPVGESLSINFDVELLKAPVDNDSLLNDNEFIDFLGNILYDIVVNRDDMTAKVDEQLEPVDLEADVHEDSYGKDHS